MAVVALMWRSSALFQPLDDANGSDYSLEHQYMKSESAY